MTPEIRLVNAARTVLVVLWEDGTAEVATRHNSAAVWGVPQRLVLDGPIAPWWTPRQLGDPGRPPAPEGGEAA